ncbi:uncharacterized protein LOC141906901 [Tubulanus polymorphus]|uniref:uncharacterized protein LOC141906901 n=1 Tax=Tubulanus polymorphus TaxID=672921 RepID=UPI003DA5B449
MMNRHNGTTRSAAGPSGGQVEALSLETNRHQTTVAGSVPDNPASIYFPTPDTGNNPSSSSDTTGVYYPPLPIDPAVTSVYPSLESSQPPPQICLPPSVSHHLPSTAAPPTTACSYDSAKYLEDYFKVIESFQGSGGGQNYNNAPPGGVSSSGYYVPQIVGTSPPGGETRNESNTDNLTPSRVAQTFNNMYARAFLNQPHGTSSGIITTPLSDHRDSSAGSGDSSADESEDTTAAVGGDTAAESSVVIVKIERELQSDKSESELETLQPVTAVTTSSSPVAATTTECVISASAGKPTRFLPPRKKRNLSAIIDEVDDEDEREERINRRKRGRPKRSIQNIEQIHVTDDDDDDDEDEIEAEEVAMATKNNKSSSSATGGGGKRKGKRRSVRGTKICEKCNRKFERNDTYQRHLLLHDTKLLYGCHVCGGKYERQEHLTRHLRVHSGELYCCDVCHSTFRQQRPFRDHMAKYHAERRPFICHIAGCTFRAQTPSQVEKHSEIHSDQKQYRCEKCGRDFAQINGLRSHQRSCYEKRQYLCDFCGAKFNFLGSLKSHRYIHTGEKPHQCPECDAKFTDHRNLRRHRLIHENAFPYPCTICDKKFRHSNSLKAHVKMHKAPSTSTSAPVSSVQSSSSSSSVQMAPSGPVSGLSTQWERPEAQLVHEYMLALQHQTSHVNQQVSQVSHV